MSSSRLPEHRAQRLVAAVVTVTLALLSGGCAKARDLALADEPPPRVALKGYPLDVAYGAESSPLEPPATVPEMMLLPGDVLIEMLDEEDEFVGDLVASVPPAPTIDDAEEPRGPCPEPGPDAVARKPVTADVRDPVAAGTYTFKQSGVLDVVGLGKMPLVPLTTRVVRNVRESTVPTTRPGETVRATEFEVELVTGLRRQVQRFRVVPGDGVFLVGVTTAAGGTSRQFNPVLPVEVFPLPATPLATVTSGGVDPITGESMVVQATVSRTVRVDGCDEVVDGWLTEGTWTFQRGPESQVYDIDYVVATQHGGLFVMDHLKTTERIGPFQATIDVTSTIGSVHPRENG